MADLAKNKETLNNQIWTTRISRVNAEKRLQEKESFIEGINIYYSCYTVLLSVILLVVQNFACTLLSLSMTITLLISIIYFKGLRYTERARDYRNHYIELQRLEFQLSHADTEEKISKIEQEYCTLLGKTENHITFDYYKTIAQSHDPYKKTRWTCSVKAFYFWGVIWRKIIKIICIILPPALTLIAYWGQCHGWFAGR